MLKKSKENKNCTLVESCIFCKKNGDLLYTGLKDKLFHSPDVWNLSICNDCSLVWLNPRPSPDLTDQIYKEYYTHEGFMNEFLLSKGFKEFPLNKKIKYAIASVYFSYSLKIPKLWTIIGSILGVVPLLRKKTFLSLSGLTYKKEANLLDIGCGNGDFLLEMKYLGWKVFGIEIDKKAALAASSLGIDVIEGTLKDTTYSENFFSAIHMNNVIEHLADPKETLERCYKILKPGGLLSIRTCSNSSLAHTFYKEDYRGLEIPRHFFIFSPLSLKKLGNDAGFKLQHLSTHLNPYIWFSSQALKKKSADAAYVVGNKITSLAFNIFYTIFLIVKPYKGDDILIILKK